MATAQLINPLHSESRSPTESRPPQRRTALLRQQLSLDIPEQSRALSSSLPSPISKKELNFLKAIHQNEKNKRQKLKDAKVESMDSESVEVDSEKLESPQDSLSAGQQRMRPRSASLFSPDRASERGTPKRKSLRGLSRSRPSSARLGRSRSRADSFKPDDTTTEKVEAIMANIKTQLTQLSEEDVMLQDRLNRLAEGINVLINSHFRNCHQPHLNPVRSVSSGTPRKAGKVVHWKDMENVDKTMASSSAPSSGSEPNLLKTSNNLPPPTVTISSSTSDVSILLNDGENEKEFERFSRPTSIGGTVHKVLKLNGQYGSCSSTSSPPPICTIVIEEPDGHIVQCPTPSSLADDEVFVL